MFHRSSAGCEFAISLVVGFLNLRAGLACFRHYVISFMFRLVPRLCSIFYCWIGYEQLEASDMHLRPPSLLLCFTLPALLSLLSPSPPVAVAEAYSYGMTTPTVERSGDGTLTVSPANESDQSALVVICHGLGDSSEGFADGELSSRAAYLRTS